jgi:predicted MFS family arabinose efflux permease
VLVIFALNGATTGTWVSRTPAMREGLGIENSQLGVLIALLSIGAMLGLLASSHVLAWLAPRRTLTAMMLALCVALALVGVGSGTGSFAMAGVGMALFGASSGIADVAQNVEGAGVEVAGGRTIMPLFHAMWSIGTVIGAGLGTLAAGIDLPLAVHTSVVAVVVAVGTLLVVRNTRASLEEESASGERGGLAVQLAIWRQPRTLLIGVVVLGFAFAEGSANDWLAIAMVDGHGVDEGAAAATFTAFAIAMTAGRVAGLWVLDRFGRVRVLAASAVLAILGLLVVILAPTAPIAVVGSVLWGLGACLGFPVGMSAASDDPVGAAARVSAVATIGYAAFLVGPPVLGMLSESFGILNALLLVLGLIAAAGLAVGAVRPPVASARPEPAPSVE